MSALPRAPHPQERPCHRPVPLVRRRLALAVVLALVAAAGGGDDDDDVAGDATSAPTEASTAATSAATDAGDRGGYCPGREHRGDGPGDYRLGGIDGDAETLPAALEGTVHLGFFPNVTHAPALVGIGEGFFAGRAGRRRRAQARSRSTPARRRSRRCSPVPSTSRSSAPTRRSTASPSPTARRSGSSPGSTSGGAYLVVKPEITTPSDLAGTTIATPSLGNTQDVALRAWLAEQGFETTPEGGGDVTILPQSNSTTLESFVAGAIDGAWVPEPWATRLILEGGGHVLVDERDLWPDTDGEYVTTHVIVRTPVPRGAPRPREGGDRRPARRRSTRSRPIRPPPRRT